MAAPANQRPTFEQRDACINNGKGKDWKPCMGLDKTRSSDKYKACKAVEDKVDQAMQEGLTDACQKLKVDIDYGSPQDKLTDSYYDCVREMSKSAKSNNYYYEHEFKPLYEDCGTLSSSEGILTLV